MTPWPALSAWCRTWWQRLAVSQRRGRTSESEITTARLTDRTDEAATEIGELLGALDMAVYSDVDAAGTRCAVRAFARLARSAHERAQEAARMAEELHEGNRREHAAGGLEQ